jgi:hypothetical protein
VCKPIIEFPYSSISLFPRNNFADNTQALLFPKIMNTSTAATAAKNFVRAPAGPNKIKVSVRFRKIEAEGFKKIDTKAATCADIADFVKKELSPSWGEFLVVPKLWIFWRLRGGDPVTKHLDDIVQKKMVYTAYESWGVMPKDAVRYCPPDFALSSVFTSPDHKSPFTLLSPLACATMKERESRWPWCSKGKAEGQTELHGLSVQLFDHANPVE